MRHRYFSLSPASSRLASAGSSFLFYNKLRLESGWITTCQFPASNATPVLRLLKVIKTLLLSTWSFFLSDVDGLEPLWKTVLVYEKLVVLFWVRIASGPFSEVEFGVVEYQLLVILVGYNLIFLVFESHRFFSDRNMKVFRTFHGRGILNFEGAVLIFKVSA